ncbi:MAG: NAD(+) diphosphatase [Woeseiaceae bacterium]|nr:NAD(+) diphosphatase [Woeseiaceae bacterium]
MQDHNVFAGAFVDRFGERRKDPDWLAAASRHADSRFVPVWGERCLVDPDAGHAILLEREDVDEFIRDPDDLVFLGLFRDQPAFAVAIEREDEPPHPDRGEFRDLRFLGTVLPPDEANLVAHARAMVIWHRTQLFCGICGSKALPDAGGNARRCANPDCGRVLFPRVDPAIIVLVSDGDRCLLGRQASWPEARYSTIAGFVEPGESLEDAVRREVYEETNVHVGQVHYHSSQPWPFPSSLMLGFHAEAISSDIVLNDAELEDARWFTREDLKSDFPKLPFRISIARRLVDHWIRHGTNGGG